MTVRLDDYPRAPAEHFRLLFYGAVLEIRAALPRLESKLGFLRGYHAQLDAIEPRTPREWWQELAAWEDPDLPLARLRASAALLPDDLGVLALAGCVEEDGRFGAVFEAAHGAPGHPRPTIGLLSAWRPDRDVRAAASRLVGAGMLEEPDHALPRMAWPLSPALAPWDVLRGDVRRDLCEGVSLRPPGAPLADLIVAPRLAQPLRRFPELLASGEAGALIVRGPSHAGRRTVAAAVAQALGRRTLELDPRTLEPPAWRRCGALATLLGAIPMLVLDPGPGEAVTVPSLPAYRGPRMIVLGRTGAATGTGTDDAVTLELGIPATGERERHWRSMLGDAPAGLAATLAGRHRMTGGHIRRAAVLARAEAALAGRGEVTAADVRRGRAHLHRRLLETHAELVQPARWSDLCVAADTAAELELLAARCRLREQLGDGPGAVGVRALLAGPSGTGKTLAARALASALEVDLYRLDLATVVDKYIGNTEKHLASVLAAAEEADIALLVDEGDALLGERTAVRSSTDRYANLETNYLLARLESFEGVIFITTNAPDRVDGAFARRMDVVVDFRPPQPAERRAIWDIHLPDGHAVGADELIEVSARCALTGGQIRNAAQHARLLALDGCAPLAGELLRASVQREYRKAGEPCPLNVELPDG
jgi:hypothetical protein